ncbi:hypothetical protein HY947_02460 [Candidatus Gottesmanbacteria bacterium]|nr:hypothetical protein [Candidatus Gottesmanbacteria bacterium]
MNIKPLRRDLVSYAKRHGIFKKVAKQILLFTSNPRHPSLHTEILEPKQLKLYSFRVDKKYRAIFVFSHSDEAEIVDINDHYL